MIHTISTRDTVGTWNDLFNPSEIDTIIELGKSLPTEKGKVGSASEGIEPEPDVRSSDVSWIHRNNDTDWIFQRYDGAVNRLNTLLFNIDVEPLQSLQFTTYSGGGSYNWHWDMRLAPEASDTNVILQRKISVVTQLSDPDDYEGGELVLAPCGRTFNIERSRGRTTAFLSFINHQVTPVTSGVRYSLVGWCEGPDWR